MTQSRFDEVVDRRKTGSLKWDGTQKRFGVEGDDLLPMWVADTEFLTPEPVIEALVRRARHGLFGYSVAPAAYFEAVQGWMRRRHGWDVAEEWMAATPGVVCAVNLLIRTLTDRGDGVVIQPPVYYPFRRGIEDNGCRVLVNRLCLDGERYRMDLEDLERKLPDAKLLILCSPHNPVGRVWSADELRTLGELCLRHGVIVVSDEIHFDLVFPGHSHTVFATLSQEIAQQSVVCTAASKTFNLPGLQPAITVIPNPRLRRDFAHTLRACGIPEPNAFCLEAVTAAYSARRGMACRAAGLPGGECGFPVPVRRDGDPAASRRPARSDVPGLAGLPCAWPRPGGTGAPAPVEGPAGPQPRSHLRSGRGGLRPIESRLPAIDAGGRADPSGRRRAEPVARHRDRPARWRRAPQTTTGDPMGRRSWCLRLVGKEGLEPS